MKKSQRNKNPQIIIAVLLFVAIIVAWPQFYLTDRPKIIGYLMNRQVAAVAAIVRSPFYYEFKVDGVLEETGGMNNSSSPYWWLNSGALFYLKEGIGKTVQGDITRNSWRTAYALSNPTDTDNGRHPQNIFRLVTRSKWLNFRQEVYARAINNQLSQSPNRNASNGILLFNRYRS